MEFNYNPRDYFAAPIASKANLFVYTGGICIANKPTLDDPEGRWEGVFLDHVPRHDLSGYLFTYTPGEEEPVKETLLSKDSGPIDIRLKPAFEEEQARVFDSEDDEDPKHIKYITDLSALHGKKVQLKPQSQKQATRFTVSNGIGYTGKLADSGDGVPDRYRFYKPSEGKPSGDHVLGHWLAIENICDLTSTFEIEIGGKVTEYDFLDGKHYYIVLGNMCDEKDKACSDEIDFQYYYSKHGGVVDEEEIMLEHVRAKAFEKGLLNFRVACNVVLASDFDGVGSIGDLA
jgi:hypothetical protein